MDIDTSYVWLIGGLLLIIVGIVLLIEFVQQFLELILGVLALVIGLQLVGYARRPRARVK